MLARKMMKHRRPKCEVGMRLLFELQSKLLVEDPVVSELPMGTYHTSSIGSKWICADRTSSILIGLKMPTTLPGNATGKRVSLTELLTLNAGKLPANTHAKRVTPVISAW